MGGELVEPPYFHSSFFIDVEPLRFARPLEKGTKCTTPPTATTQHHPLGGWGSNLWANNHSPLQFFQCHTKKSVPRRKPTFLLQRAANLSNRQLIAIISQWLSALCCLREQCRDQLLASDIARRWQ